MRLNGGQRGIAEMVEKWYLPIYRYAYRLTGSVADAEDLTQEAFCKAQLNHAQLRDENRARSWLFSILRNAYLHRIRADGQQRCLPLDQVDELAAPSSSSDTFPEVSSERLQQALSELDEGFRTPIILFYFEDFSYRDIAEQMELPIGTVMSRLARAKEHLRRRLSPSNASLMADGPRRATDGL